MAYFQRPGGFATLYLGSAYAVGIALFLVVLDYPSISGVEQKMEQLVANAMLFHIMQLILYVVFGIVLVIFALALPLPNGLGQADHMVADAEQAIDQIETVARRIEGAVIDIGDCE